ncbi:MAG: hypothetical protein IIV16_02485 [Alistipes sp.]|nr:hypothetical protein [Alistipes sp.]
MLRRVFIALVAICLFSACASHSVSIFDADKAVLVSGPENRMSHCASTHIFPDGEVWVAHYRDLEGNVEDPVNTTIEIVLSRFNMEEWQSPKIRHTQLFKAGAKLGDFQQGDYAAYDPVLFEVNGAMRCIIQAFENGESCLAAFDIDRTNGTPTDKMMRCTLTYQTDNGAVTIPLKGSALRDFYQRQGVTEWGNYERPLIDKKFVRHGEWYYNVLCNWYCKKVPPTIVRTKDGVSYEVAFLCHGYDYGCTEGSIAIYDNQLYLIGRSRSPYRGSFIGCFSLEGKTLRAPYYIGDDGSRPEMIVHKGKVYAMYNILPNHIDDNGRKIYRSRVRLAELDKECKIVRSWDYEAPYSMQYFCLNEHNGDVYLTFTEDRFHRADKQKGNIAFVKTKL